MFCVASGAFRRGWMASLSNLAYNKVRSIKASGGYIIIWQNGEQIDSKEVSTNTSQNFGEQL
jgi:hypothetical protein